jgi:hypothetical protein
MQKNEPSIKQRTTLYRWKRTNVSVIAKFVLESCVQILKEISMFSMMLEKITLKFINFHLKRSGMSKAFLSTDMNLVMWVTSER